MCTTRSSKFTPRLGSCLCVLGVSSLCSWTGLRRSFTGVRFLVGLHSVSVSSLDRTPRCSEATYKISLISSLVRLLGSAPRS